MLILVWEVTNDLPHRVHSCPPEFINNFLHIPHYFSLLRRFIVSHLELIQETHATPSPRSKGAATVFTARSFFSSSPPPIPSRFASSRKKGGRKNAPLSASNGERIDKSAEHTFKKLVYKRRRRLKYVAQLFLRPPKLL